MQKVSSHGGRKIVYHQRRNLSQVIYLYTYEPWYGVDMGNAIRTLKYSGYQGIAAEMAKLLFEVLHKNEFYLDSDAITVVPLHPARFRERGFNQSALIGKYLSRYLDIPYHTLLRRRKNNPSQTELSPTERELNVKDIFSLDGRIPLDSLKIILLDDQVTTGATLNSASGVLIDAGADIVLGLAVTH